ncbi:ABC transporter substrate-binding protein, partial [Terrabacter sp. MAHUQ-38]|nr:ABC transporter substrate-binding protein [Terrabacter sp. MAHUQ-38]
MRVATKLAAVASGAALVMTISACGGVGGADASGGATAGAGADAAPTGSLPEVQPDPAAVKLLPADIKARGTLTMAADLHYPPTSFLDT